MSDKGQDKVIAFDTLFTTNQIQMMKIFMPFLDLSMQKNIAIYIKIMELQYTISFFKRYPSASVFPLPKESHNDSSKIIKNILPYCNPEDRSKIENISNMFESFERYKEIMETVQMMKDLFPDGDNPLNSDLLSGLTGMSGFSDGGFDPAQMFEMFQMFQSMSNSDCSNDNNE